MPNFSWWAMKPLEQAYNIGVLHRLSPVMSGAARQLAIKHFSSAEKEAYQQGFEGRPFSAEPASLCSSDNTKSSSDRSS